MINFAVSTGPDRVPIDVKWWTGGPFPNVASERIVRAWADGDELRLIVEFLRGRDQRTPAPLRLGEFPPDIWIAFHQAWTWAVGRPGYDKDRFRQMEQYLLELNRPALATDWDTHGESHAG